MHAQQRIDAWTLALHELAVPRLSQADAKARALATLARWRTQRGPQSSDIYLDQWQRALEAGPDAVAKLVCNATSLAATLRSMSPLATLITPAEREAARKAAHEAA